MSLPSPGKIKNKECCQVRKCSYFTCHFLLVLSFTHDHRVDKIFKRMCCVLSEAFEMSTRGCQQRRSSGSFTLCCLLGPLWAKCYENRPVTLKDLCFNTQDVFSKREFGLGPRRAHSLCVLLQVSGKLEEQKSSFLCDPTWEWVQVFSDAGVKSTSIN